MSKNKCSFCYTEETDRIYWHSEITKACMCGNCSVQFAMSVLEKREQDSEDEPENDSTDKNEQFQEWLVSLEDKWMEKNVINSHILDAGGVLNEVHFRFQDEDDGYYFICELQLSGIDSLPDDVEENIYNEIEWAFDEIREDLESEGIDLDAYLGERLELTKVDNDSGKNVSHKKSKDGESNINLKNLTASYRYLQQINLGIIVEDYEDLIECMNTPSILILSSDGYESNLVIAGDDQQKLFEDIYEAYDYCAKFISGLKIVELSNKKILGLITSATDEDEDGMYETLQNEGGEILLSQSIDIQTLREEAEDSLNNTDLFDMPFCLVQYTDSANINIESGSLSANGSDIELSEITELPGYMDSMENKVCVYVS